MAHNMPELVTKHSCLLPLREVFVDGDCFAPQRPFPKAVDRWRQINEIDETI
jgi:hypothetical protein